jgi:hypothetical protein
VHVRDHLNAIGWSLCAAGSWLGSHGLAIASVIGIGVGAACHIVQTRIRAAEAAELAEHRRRIERLLADQVEVRRRPLRPFVPEMPAPAEG